MKKIFAVSLVFFSVTTALQAQLKDTTQPVLSHQSADLLFQKARKQKTAAWVLLAAGAGVAIAGSIIYTNDIEKDPFRGLLYVGAGGIMEIAGAASMITSIPFFIASGKNRRKAELMLKNESNSLLNPLYGGKKFISLGINIRL